MRLNNITKSLIVVFIIVILLESAYSGFIVLSSQSYSTGYQGAKATYGGIKYGSRKYKGTGFDTTFAWDYDPRGEGMPGMAGEMTSVFIPRETVGTTIRKFGSGADITEWLLESTKIRNPYNSWEWDLPVEGNQTAVYRMEEWVCKWYFSISCEPVGLRKVGQKGEVIATPNPGSKNRNYYLDVEVWFKMDLTPTWYFEGTDNVYFAIAKAKISDVALGGKLTKAKVNEEYEEESNAELRVTPMSKGSILPIYYGLFGSESNRAEKTQYSYNGKKLNPDLFTDVVYTYFRLNDFGVSSWWGVTRTAFRSDVVTIGVDLHVFVIGEWIVQDIDDVPTDEEGGYGRSSLEQKGLGQQLGEFFGTPTGRLMMVILGVIAFLIFCSIFAPWVLLLIFSLLQGGRRRRS